MTEKDISSYNEVHTSLELLCWWAIQQFAEQLSFSIASVIGVGPQVFAIHEKLHMYIQTQKHITLLR